MKIIKWFSAILGTLIVVIVIALAFFDWNMLRGYLSNLASESLGRRVEIVGDLDVHLSFTPRVLINNVHVANTPWGQDPLMAKIALIDTKIKLIPLIFGRVEIVRLQINNPEVLLEKNKDGIANWQFTSSSNNKKPSKEGSSGMPPINELLISNGTVRYHDWADALDFTATTINIGGGLPATGPSSLKGDWQVYDLPFAINLQADPINDLNKVVELASASQAGSESKKPWGLKQGKIKIGESIVDVVMNFSIRDARPYIEANITSSRFLFKDLRTLNKRMIEGPQEKQVLPQNKINTAFLKTIDSTINFNFSNIETPTLKTVFKGNASLEKGYLEVKISKFALANGEILGKVTLDSRPTVPQASADLNIKGLQIHSFLKKSEYTDGTSGKLFGSIGVKAQGETTAKMVDSADGQVTFLINGGSLDNIIVEALGLDVAELIGVISYDTRKKEIPTHLRCAVGILPIKEGTLQAKTFIVDTKDSNIIGEGSINLGHEKFNLKLTTHPKDFSALSGRAPILITGTFRDPHVRPGPALAGKALAALALGALVTPLAALIPFIDPGSAKDENCSALFKKTTKAAKKASNDLK